MLAAGMILLQALRTSSASLFLTDAAILAGKFVAAYKFYTSDVLLQLTHTRVSIHWFHVGLAHVRLFCTTLTWCKNDNSKEPAKGGPEKFACRAAEPTFVALLPCLHDC